MAHGGQESALRAIGCFGLLRAFGYQLLQDDLLLLDAPDAPLVQ
jgi:hypothetical protein